jgi:hypothetical protein
VTAPEYTSAEALAAALRTWGQAIDRYTRLVRPGTGELHEIGARLQFAAEWVGAAGRLERSAIAQQLREMRRRQAEHWDSVPQAAEATLDGAAGRASFLAGIDVAIELIETGIPSVTREVPPRPATAPVPAPVPPPGRCGMGMDRPSRQVR